jgi:hypothetical protein
MRVRTNKVPQSQTLTPDFLAVSALAGTTISVNSTVLLIRICVHYMASKLYLFLFSMVDQFLIKSIVRLVFTLIHIRIFMQMNSTINELNIDQLMLSKVIQSLHLAMTRYLLILRSLVMSRVRLISS